jgi:hypothetical protein
MPIADLFMGVKVHVGASLAREEEHHQHGEKHHVAREAKKHKKANAVEKLARPTVFSPPIVVAPPASAAGGASVYRWLTADSWLFAFRLRRGMRKGGGHSGPL